MSARARLRDRLSALGARPTAPPSPEFVTALGDRLVHTAAPVVVTGASRGELREGLVRLGGVAAKPAPAFVAALEDRLAHTDPTDEPAVVALAPRRRSVVGAGMAAAATVAAVLIATALLGGFGSGGHAGVQLGNAVDVTVVLPNGQVVHGQPGLSLPNGSVVRTGTNGHVKVGAVTLGPGEQGVVNGGQLIPSTPSVPPVTPTLPNVPVTLPAAPPVTLPSVPPVPHLPLPVPTTLPKLLPLPNLLPGLIP